MTFARISFLNLKNYYNFVQFFRRGLKNQPVMGLRGRSCIKAYVIDCSSFHLTSKKIYNYINYS